MAHVGEKGRFEPVGGLGFLLGYEQFPFHLFHFRDVPFDVQQDGGEVVAFNLHLPFVQIDGISVSVAFFRNPEGNKISSAAASHSASVAASAESVAPRVRSRSEAKASPVIDDGISEPRISVSAKRKPAPYVKGLQYGKPLKTTEGYTYVGSKPRRRIDKFMVIAIVVAVLAVGVIVYGYLRRAKIERLEREYLEQLAPAVPEPVAAGTDEGVEAVSDTNQE